MRKKRLLIINDDPTVSQTLQSLAKTSGFEVITTDTNIAFFAQLALFEPDVIIADIEMSMQDCLRMVDQLVELNPRAQLVILSNLDNSSLDTIAQHATGLELIVLGILHKPAPAEKVLQLLKLYLNAGKRGLINRNAWQGQVHNKNWMPTQSDLIEVIEKDLLTLRYQPKLDCVTGSLIGFEALARWEIEGKGTITPDVFVPLAENSHLMSVLTCNIARRGLRCLSTIQASPFLSRRNSHTEFSAAPLTLSLNLSVKCLEDQDMPEKLQEICQQTGVDPTSIVIEIGESSVMQDPEDLLQALNKFHKLGFQLAIDDFGTSFSSMLYLVRMPLSEIKIDKDFVRIADDSEEARSIIKCSVELAGSLGIRSVAAGVETEATLQYLKTCGCDAFQGYLVSRPVDEDKVLAWSKQYCESVH
ncbi:hypothetical protein PHACT_13130 [Pseudohongiella acticola]|uniref:EAL domain-containing protein n=1 Tax=Pseudohongiella acticola TaxID=1524254 RepID=A0A1E8CGF9_9GAMM|nr:EAL domain-containing response regulator [Pseudohongiella acticola]OFE11486.1 hypothetical protein PHACT_13130 [Pseudohongiella acticola]